MGSDGVLLEDNSIGVGTQLLIYDTPSGIMIFRSLQEFVEHVENVENTSAIGKIVFMAMIMEAGVIQDSKEGSSGNYVQ